MSQSANQPGQPARASRQTSPRKQIEQPRRLPPYNVILLNDDDHTFDYVIEMLSSLFGYNPARGYLMAEQLNPKGRVIVLTTHKEHAEFKRDQIQAFGRDKRIDHCAGSMSAIIEPVS
jgi:ATP-dependent Clp protease adaptor protein ClpS